MSTHWGRVTHICVRNVTIIYSDNGLSPGRRQAITWTNIGILLIGPIGTNFSEMLIEIHIFSFKKTHLKMSSGKWRPFCIGLNVLTIQVPVPYIYELRHQCACRWPSTVRCQAINRYNADYQFSHLFIKLFAGCHDFWPSLAHLMTSFKMADEISRNPAPFRVLRNSKYQTWTTWLTRPIMMRAHNQKVEVWHH